MGIRFGRRIVAMGIGRTIVAKGFGRAIEAMVWLGSLTMGFIRGI